jgi:hypothetical protein
MSISLHEGQSQVFTDLFLEQTVRHAVVVASRGWGKSWFAGTCAVNAVFELLELHRNVPNKNVYIIAPTYDQVTDIYYPMLAYQMGLEDYCIKSSRDTGIFWFDKDVVLRLVSYEAVERLRGKGAYFVVNDEVSSWKKGIGLKEAWEGVIQPCIATRWSPKRARAYLAKSPGRSLTISTPMGYNYFYDMSNMGERDPLWRSYHFDYHSSPFLDPDEIERIKHNIDPLRFAREYLANFEDSGNNVFYCFNRKTHVTSDIPEFRQATSYQKMDGEEIHCAIDFNVGIQATSVWAIRGNQAHCLDEFKGHPDTETLAQVLKAKYKNKGHKVYVYPDPSGKDRKTSAAVGVTDFSILQSAGLTVLAKNKAPGIVDSVACVNRKLKTAAGDVDAYIHPRCVGTITSLERTSWVDKNPDLAVIDKSEGIEHFSDGVRYLFDYKFPIRNGSAVAKRGFGF